MHPLPPSVRHLLAAARAVWASTSSQAAWSPRHTPGMRVLTSWSALLARRTSENTARPAAAAWAAPSTCSSSRPFSSRPPPPTGGATADPVTVDLLGGGSASSSDRVEAYDSTGFEVGGVRVEGSLLVAPGGLVAAWGPRRLSEVSADSLAAVRLLGPAPPTLLILGVGARPAQAPPAALAALAGGTTGIEALPTPQAAALYNVLSQEGRSVCGAFLPAGEVE